MNREESLPEAIFDTVYIGTKLEHNLKDFSLFEIQFFSYLSCLISLYNGRPLSSWEYGFSKTKFGSPYSVEIEKSWRDLNSWGSIEETTIGYMKTTSVGRSKMNVYFELGRFKERIQYLDAACKCLTIFPMTLIRSALSNEPILKSAKFVKRRYLLDDESPSFKELYEQFDKLRILLERKKYEDLLIPAVVWLESLLTLQKGELTIS